jgi:hypothetical protein
MHTLTHTHPHEPTARNSWSCKEMEPLALKGKLSS